MPGLRPPQAVTGSRRELVQGLTATHPDERRRPDRPLTDDVPDKPSEIAQRAAPHDREGATPGETVLPHGDVGRPPAAAGPSPKAWPTDSTCRVRGLKRSRWTMRAGSGTINGLMWRGSWPTTSASGRPASSS